MNKKIFFLILTSIVVIIISNFITYTVTGKTYAGSDLIIFRDVFNEEVKYIQITDQTLQNYPELKVRLDGIDQIEEKERYSSSGERVYQTSQFPAIVTLSNDIAIKYKSFLEELMPENPDKYNRFYLERDGKYYSVSITKCFPYCGPYL